MIRLLLAKRAAFAVGVDIPESFSLNYESWIDRECIGDAFPFYLD